MATLLFSFYARLRLALPWEFAVPDQRFGKLTFALCCCYHPNQPLHNTFCDDATDDDGRLGKDEKEEPVDLEVAHIIPHSLVSLNDALMQLVLLPLPVTLFN